MVCTPDRDRSEAKQLLTLAACEMVQTSKSNNRATPSRGPRRLKVLLKGLESDYTEPNPLLPSIVIRSDRKARGNSPRLDRFSHLV